MSAAAIPAVATNAVEAISSFFIFKFLVELFILGPPLENPVSDILLMNSVTLVKNFN